MIAAEPYRLAHEIRWPAIAGPLARAEDALARLDERLSRSAIRDGWIARTYFGEACAALWLDGELIHLEDLVLHDAGMDVRAPTRELIRAHAILRARRRIAAAAPEWALSDAGLAALRGETLSEEGRGSGYLLAGDDARDEADWEPPRDDPADERLDNAGGEFSDVDVLIARSQRAIDGEARPRPTLVYDLDWRENG